MNMQAFPALSDHILVWVFGMIIPFLSGMQSDKLKGELSFTADARKRLYLGNAFMLMISGLIIVAGWLWHSRPLQTLGVDIHISQSTTLYILISFFVIAYTTELIISTKKRLNRTQAEEKEWFEESSFLPEKRNELPYYILLCMAAGIFEEIIYRGFMINYFLPDKQVSIFIFILRISAPAALFSMAHYYQGWSSVAKIFIFSLLLSLMYVESGSLIPGMILHFLVDLISGLTAMKKKNRNAY